MATKIKCVNKVRDKNGIIKVYQLIDENGNKIEATSSQVKEEIRAGRYDFINLQIDKAGRLVDKKTEAVANSTTAAQKTNRPSKSESYLKAVEQCKADDVLMGRKDGNNGYIFGLKKVKPLYSVLDKLASDIEDKSKEEGIVLLHPETDNVNALAKKINVNSYFGRNNCLPDSVKKFMDDTGAGLGFVYAMIKFVFNRRNVGCLQIADFMFITDNIDEVENSFNLIAEKRKKEDRTAGRIISLSHSLDEIVKDSGKANLIKCHLYSRYFSNYSVEDIVNETEFEIDYQMKEISEKPNIQFLSKKFVIEQVLREVYVRMFSRLQGKIFDTLTEGKDEAYINNNMDRYSKESCEQARKYYSERFLEVGNKAYDKYIH